MLPFLSWSTIISYPQTRLSHFSPIFYPHFYSMAANVISKREGKFGGVCLATYISEHNFVFSAVKLVAD